MIQASLLDWQPPATDRHGETYSRAFDEARLNRQALLVYQVVAKGGWWTLREIAEKTQQPEASISARLRDFRNMHGLTVNRRRRGEETRGIWEYSIA